MVKMGIFRGILGGRGSQWVVKPKLGIWVPIVHLLKPTKSDVAGHSAIALVCTIYPLGNVTTMVIGGN